MKVSMSNALEGIEVTVSLTCAEPSDLPSGPALQLQSQPGGDEAEVSDRLLGTLNRALPGVLGEAVGQLRIAIAEMHLSRISESRKAYSFAEALKDYEGVAYSPARPLTEIIVVYGSEECRTPANAGKLKAHFKPNVVIEGENSARAPQPGERTLILTNYTLSSAIEALSLDRQADAQKFDSVRFISFTAAMQELN
jgi:hypothetical protein